MRRVPLVLAGTALIATGVLLSPATAATPTSGTLTVPSAVGQVRTLTYGGTVPTSVNPTSDCSTLGAALVDSYKLTVKAPGGGYSALRATFDFTLEWKPVDPTGVGTSDLVLEVVGPTGTTVGSSDESENSGIEHVRVTDLASGDYTVYACGYLNGASQDYVGTVSVRTSSLTEWTGLPASPAVLNDSFTTYTPATVVDPILYGAEPALSFDPFDTSTRRNYVSWPVSSRTHIGTLYRTDDGALSYIRRQGDSSNPEEGGPACLGRPRPYCFAGGGGDTDIVVQKDASGKPVVYMADQEFLANQAVGASFDNGTSFPLTHVDAAVAKTSGVDRQWLGVWDGTNDVFLAYHVPLAGEFVNHSTQNGAVGSWDIPTTPQIPGVTQSGSMYIDNAAASPHKKAIYIGYVADGINSAPDGGSAFDPSAEPLSGFAVAVSTDGAKTFVNHKIPGADDPRNFTKLFGDTQGNLYATWTDSQTQQTYLATAMATKGTNAANPASSWSKPARISSRPVNVSIFPDIVAGDPGRIAVIYYGTTVNAASPDDVPKGAGGWFPYIAFSTNALCQWDASPCASPTFHQTTVAHKLNHDDNICTSGTTCAATGGNRNMADFWDISVDPAGHVGLVFNDTVNGNGQPYVKVARQASGPSLYAGKPAAALSLRGNGVADAAGDAKLPLSGASYLNATNKPTLDLRSASVAVKGSNLEFRIALASAADLGGNVPSGVDGTTPIQQVKYLVRWDDTKGSYYAGANVASGGQPQFFSGTVGPAEALLVTGGGTTAYGNTYAAQTPATGRVDGNTLVIDVPTSAVNSPTVGTRIFSVGAYSIVGPTDQLALVNTAPLAVDGTPTFDTRLAATTPTAAPPPVTTPTGGQPGTGGNSGSGGNLAATGGSAALSLAGAVLLGLALLTRRRRDA